MTDRQIQRGERERERVEEEGGAFLTFELDTSRANTKELTAELDDLKGDTVLLDAFFSTCRNVYIHYGFISRLSTNATELQSLWVYFSSEQLRTKRKIRTKEK